VKISEHRVGKSLVTEHEWVVPVNHDEPGETITLFAREVTLGALAVKTEAEVAALPWLVFLQGGPGFEATRPMGSFGWVDRAAENYRVLLLDQRGTGRSSAVDVESLSARGDAQSQAAYLRHFRPTGLSVIASLSARRWELNSGVCWVRASVDSVCCTTFRRFPPRCVRAFSPVESRPSRELPTRSIVRRMRACGLETQSTTSGTPKMLIRSGVFVHARYINCVLTIWRSANGPQVSHVGSGFGHEHRSRRGPLFGGAGA
jgi:hypothetical protein